MLGPNGLVKNPSMRYSMKEPFFVLSDGRKEVFITSSGILPIHVVRMEFHFIFLPDDTVYLTGFGRECADVLEFNVVLQVHAVLCHALLL